jgi:hypothetical protein
MAMILVDIPPASIKRVISRVAGMKSLTKGGKSEKISAIRIEEAQKNPFREIHAARMEKETTAGNIPGMKVRIEGRAPTIKNPTMKAGKDLQVSPAFRKENTAKDPIVKMKAANPTATVKIGANPGKAEQTRGAKAKAGKPVETGKIAAGTGKTEETKTIKAEAGNPERPEKTEAGNGKAGERKTIKEEAGKAGEKGISDSIHQAIKKKDDPMAKEKQKSLQRVANANSENMQEKAGLTNLITGKRILKKKPLMALPG